MNTSLLTETHLVETARILYSSGLTTSHKGVLAVRPGNLNFILMTAAKSDFRSIDQQDICKINLAGEIISKPPLQEVPANLKFYLKVFQDRADVSMLAHLYPPYASVFAEKAQLFELSETPAHSLVRELIKVECLECPSRFTGLCSCRSDLRKSYAGADALLIKQDGVIVLADEINSLILKVQSIEDAAHKSFSPG